MSDLNLDASISPDGVTLYKYLWVYLDHFTKKVNLAPLKRKCAEEVTEVLLDIFVMPDHLIFCTPIMEESLRTKYCSQLSQRNGLP